MGRIHEDVRNTHLRVAPQEEELINAFLTDFNINYARRINIYITRLYPNTLKICRLACDRKSAA